MKRTLLQQEIRKMRFEEAYRDWSEKRLTQEEAARLLGVHERTFRRYIDRHREQGIEGLVDRRLNQISHRRTPVDEQMKMLGLYTERYSGWNVKHFHKFYQREHQGQRSYTWVKNTLQAKGLVNKGKSKGVHRKRRPRSPMPGMMIHQDGSTHQWISGQYWDLICTMDDATNEHYSLFFVLQEGTRSSFQGVKETIEKKGLFCSFYSDRGSHYWTTPEAGGPVDKNHPTQFGRAMRQLGIEMIAAYSPEARGRSERMFGTHQGRLPKELALHGICDIEPANRYIGEIYMPRFNEEFMVTAPLLDASAFVPWMMGEDALTEILSEQVERVVGKDNCVHMEGLILQIPANIHRCHYMKRKVRVHRYADGRLSVFHGPKKLALYSAHGDLLHF